MPTSRTVTVKPPAPPTLALIEARDHLASARDTVRRMKAARAKRGSR